MDALVQWGAASDPEGDLVGYNVFHGYAFEEYFEWFTVMAPALQLQFTGLDDFKTHHFAVTSFDEVPNESDRSGDVSKRVPHRFTMK